MFKIFPWILFHSKPHLKQNKTVIQGIYYTKYFGNFQFYQLIYFINKIIYLNLFKKYNLLKYIFLIFYPIF